MCLGTGRWGRDGTLGTGRDARGGTERGAILSLRVSDAYLGRTWITGEEGDMKGSKFILNLSMLPFTFFKSFFCFDGCNTPNYPRTPVL